MKKPTGGQANYRVEEIYNPNLPYNAVLLPPGGGTASRSVEGLRRDSREHSSAGSACRWARRFSS